MISVIYDDYSKLNDFFDKIYEGDKSKNIYVLDVNHNKETYNKILNINSKDNIKEDIKELIHSTIKIVSNNNFKINPSKYYVEFHKYFVNGKTKSFFDFHEDDEGVVSYKTVTCIYYLTKNDTIKGGDLEFKNEKIINIESNMLVIFNGSLTHRMTSMDGNGIRKSIIIQFERL